MAVIVCTLEANRLNIHAAKEAVDSRDLFE